MKNTGKCPKCGSERILTVVPDMISTNQYDPRIRGGMFGTTVKVGRYVCRACGYVEQWVDPEELERSGVADYWEKKAAEEQAYQREYREGLDRWNRKAAQQKEKEEQAQRLREKETQRKDDPWN